MWRLVLDSIRRQKVPLLASPLYLTPLWLGVDTTRTWSVATAFAWSAFAACFLGPQLSLLTFTPREIRQLPVSRRDVWRALWVRSAVIAPLVTTMGKLPVLIVAPLGGHVVGAPGIALSFVYDATYAAASTVWLILIAQRRVGSGPRRWWSVTGDIATLMLLLAAPVWPFVLRQHLATRWSDLSAPSIMALVALLGIAVVTFFYRPGAAASGAPFATPRQAHLRPTQHTSRVSGATGLRRFVLNELTWTAIIAAVILPTFSVVEYLADLVTSGWGHGILPFLRATWLLPFDARPATIPDPTNLLIWLAFFMLSVTARFAEMLRHLRALPFGAARLNAMLVAWPLVMWSLIWAGLLVIHAAALQASVESLRPALFVTLVGMSALASALQLRWGLKKVPWLILGVVVGSRFFPYLLSWITLTSLVVLGIAGILTALALNASTLARSRTYAPRHPTSSLG